MSTCRCQNLRPALACVGFYFSGIPSEVSVDNVRELKAGMSSNEFNSFLFAYKSLPSLATFVRSASSLTPSSLEALLYPSHNTVTTPTTSIFELFVQVYYGMSYYTSNKSSGIIYGLLSLEKDRDVIEKQ